MRRNQHDGPLVGAAADGGEVVAGEIGRVLAVSARVEVDDLQDVLLLEGDASAERGLADARVARDDEAVLGGLRLEVDDAGAGAAETCERAETGAPPGGEAEGRGAGGFGSRGKAAGVASVQTYRGRAAGEGLGSVDAAFVWVLVALVEEAGWGRGLGAGA